EGQVSEIHLVGSASRRPKQIVRDVESLLYAHYGVHIDYRKISLVQLDAETVTAHLGRLRFLGVQPHPARENCVQVILQSEEVRYEGTAPLAVDAPEQLCAQAAAQATLEAVQQAIGHAVPLEVRDLQLLAPVGHRVCLAIIAANTPQGEEQLSGTCLVTGSVLEAGCKATLDALNRRLPVWTRQKREGGEALPGWAEAHSP
ncbi:MAG: hypothetical protein H5T69_18450, partial [Chloroflexi bacterium]|nr:hypothetical protein [Chloroflexota bacterium]